MKTENLSPQPTLQKEAAEKLVEDKKAENFISEYLKEQGIEAPPVKLHIYYNIHSRPKDLAKVEGALREADIVFPEIAGWDKRGLDIINQVSLGSLPAEEGLKKFFGLESPPPYYRRLFEILYGSNKIVRFVDISSRHEINERSWAAIKKFDNNFDRIFKEPITFEELADQLRIDIVDIYNVVVRDREEHIVNRFGPEIKKALEQDPGLLKKENIQTLMIFGAGHSDFYQRLKSEGLDVTREFSHDPLVFNYLVEIYRRLKNNRPVSEDLYAKAVLSQIFARKGKFKNLLAELDSSADIEVARRKIIDQFSTKEIKEILSHARDSRFSEYLDNLIKYKNIALVNPEERVSKNP